MVEMLKFAIQRAWGWLATLSRMTCVRESFGLAATQRTTFELGSRYMVPDSVPAEAEPVTYQPAANARLADTAAAATTRRRRKRRVSTGTPSCCCGRGSAWRPACVRSIAATVVGSGPG